MADLRGLQDVWLRKNTQEALHRFRLEHVNRPRTMYALTVLGYKRHEATKLIAAVLAEKREAMLCQLARDLSGNGK